MDLSKDGGPVSTLAWVIRHFVPLVVDDPPKFWGSMLAGMPLFNYMTVADIAFAFLILEQYMMKWRALIHFELETGRPSTDSSIQQTPGLLYNGGISGQAAKGRYQNLCSYFFANLASPQKDRNLKKLQAVVNNLARKDSESIKTRIRTFSGTALSTPVLEQIQEDILHRVFNLLCM